MVRAMRKTLIGLAAAGLMALLLPGGCAVHRTALADLPAEPMAGHYEGGRPGESWFRPCGAPSTDKSWWVTFGGRSVAQVDEKKAAGLMQPGQRYFVRWRGAVTTSGEIGPQGPGVPAVYVRELTEVREASLSDCASATPAR